jgi:hypothetical protein
MNNAITARLAKLSTDEVAEIAAKMTVIILGSTVTVGTKKHAKLLAEAKHYDDLRKYETN